MATSNSVSILMKIEIKEERWRQIFQEMGKESMLSLEDLEADDMAMVQIGPHSLSFCIFTKRDIEGFVECLYERLKKEDESVEVEYTYERGCMSHGYWRNGVLKEEDINELYSIVRNELTPQKITPQQSQAPEFFDVDIGEESFRALVQSVEKQRIYSDNFKRLFEAPYYICKHPQEGYFGIIEFNGQYYSEDVEHRVFS